MRQQHILKFLRIELLSIYLIASSVVAAETVKKSHFIDATPIKRVAPEYPGAEARVANSGMVELLFMIDAEGNVFEPMVERSTRRSFEQYAIKAVSKYKYSPATLNGKPIESRQSIRIAFQIRNSEDKVSYGFGKNYKKFNTLIAADQLNKEKLAKLIVRMESSVGMTPYAHAYLSLAKLQYAKKFGSVAKQIENVEQLLLFEGRTGKTGKFIDEQIRVGIRRNLVNLNIQSQRYGSALTAYSELQKIDDDAKDIFGEAYQQIIEISNNDNLVSVDVKITDKDYTSFLLFKKNFALLDVKGNIDRLKLRCKRKFKELEFVPDAEYLVPESWGACNLQIMGEPNTTAKLAQF